MIIDGLAAVVGAEHVFGPDAVEPRYLEDETGGEAGRPAGMVRPADAGQVSAVLARCHAVGQPVVVQGGRTGMARGGLPRAGELILSLERMAAVEAIDGDAGLMTVGAGCILEVAQNAAAEAGWRLAVDIGARGSCTIGGMIATNAGGTQVLRYGMMRDQVLGLEAILADGTVISSLGSMLKNNTGYDLKQFFIGSEGTLGIVTRAVLRLRPPAIGRQTALCAVADYPAAVRLLARLERAMPGQLSAYELMWSDFFDAACAVTGQAYPFADTHELIVLAETESADPDALTAALEESFGDGTVHDALVAQSDRDHQRFWRFRDAIGELVGAMAVVEPFDVSAPIGAIGGLVADLRGRLRVEAPGSRPICFGHIADGNLHLALELASEAQRPIAEAIVYDAVRAVGGSVSAEHGIGTLKRAWLGHSRSPAEMAMMRTIRAALDPKGILNPDRIF
ncbi:MULTISPECIES: FAD-binding oxidoreductase [unclassified Sphingomonas]|uniref:FAD-binding oxidoreductase n=1 Tax=unclassified Sphingomonas TaxID=196159 RepID=UPI0007017B43|nr:MULTISPECIES: FAD-binding oxidoreductase [unclassified Sphingomonas]KQX18665.1 FAD-linked oxidase [Sphingomonas sp. Root1294]KQY72012.1 FAD-linked oxidase [Sphingomonas sp. Root50]KRB94720.1 FAD-linked oxidase [Sphingomonas sp. Root720]